MEIAIGSYLIGFVCSWFMGAAPVDFPQIDFTNNEKTEIVELKQDIQDDPEDVYSLVRLGQIYFMHNHLDQAEEVLDKAKKQEPDNPDVLAWWGSTRTKKAGAAVPWFWGIKKIYVLKDGIEAVNKAIEIAPHNPEIRYIRTKILLSLKGEYSDFDLIFEDEKYFYSLSKEDLKAIPSQLMGQINLAFAEAYVWKMESTENEQDIDYHKKILQYLNKAEQKDPSLKQKVIVVRKQI